MTEEAREARNAYMREYQKKHKAREKAKEWRAANKDKVKAYQEKYWARVAERTKEAQI